MTNNSQNENSSNNRLNRIERLIEANAQAMQAGHKITAVELRTAISNTMALISKLAEKHEQSHQRFNLLVEESRADRRRADERFNQVMEAFQAERQRSDEQFNQMVEEMRGDRQRNDSAHEAFTEAFQSMLAEIARIWQRLAG